MAILCRGKEARRLTGSTICKSLKNEAYVKFLNGWYLEFFFFIEFPGSIYDFFSNHNLKEKSDLGDKNKTKKIFLL